MPGRVHFDPVLAEPPAVQLDVHYDASSGGHALIFTLFDRQGRALTLPQRRPLRVDPQRYAAQLYASLSTLAEAAAPTNAAAFEAEVRALGWRLWAELLPAAIKAAYAAHRSAWAGRTLLVVSDEPWIPWELVLPYDDPAGAWRDEAPWAVSLSLQRWLGGDATTAAIPGPPVRLALASLACIAPHRRDLRFAATERRHLQTLAARLSLRDLSPADARLATVLALLREGGYDWLHFAAHGELDEDATAAAIALEDGNLLPDLLYGPEIRPQIARTRPGVMLNICHGARSLWSLTHLGGWAQWFLSAGAGLFVAPLWTVTDHHAAAFAQTFYDRLTAPPVDPATPRATVAEAVSAARQATQGDGDPTWLAYSIYAHPHARLAPVTI
ncbi:MAG: CHAT domain-containing protein [Anaerolineales bacterium]|nr:CHAT domain-containing protein [Anaerolineales bacterium]